MQKNQLTLAMQMQVMRELEKMSLLDTNPTKLAQEITERVGFPVNDRNISTIMKACGMEIQKSFDSTGIQRLTVLAIKDLYKHVSVSPCEEVKKLFKHMGVE
jgi:hypothetical protein